MAVVPKLNTMKFDTEMPFRVDAPFSPMGDQPKAIEDLAQGIESGMEAQVLLGATGTGKTFTIAKVIEKVQSRRLSSRTTKRWRRSSPASSRRFSPTITSAISSVITIITSRRRISLQRTPILKRMRRSTTRSMSFAIRRPARCLSAGT